jgi:hypothetical protein
MTARALRLCDFNVVGWDKIGSIKLLLVASFGTFLLNSFETHPNQFRRNR